MASKVPPIPKDQRSGPKERPDIADTDPGRRDRTTGDQSSEPGDGDINLKEQGRHGNINQNTHHQGYQQDR